MRYSVLGFNQELVVAKGLDLTDLLLLDYVYTACGSPSMVKVVDEKNQPYVWLKHSKILSDIPVINIGEEMLKKRIKSLIDRGLLKSQVKSNNSLGRQAYYTITEECENLRFSNQVEYITRGTEDQVEKITLATPQPSVINYTSYTQLAKDKELDIPKGKDKSSQKSEEPLSDFESKMFSEDIKAKRRREKIEEPKPKKLSLWDKCVQHIEEYTDDEKLREALMQYLKVRLAMRDKPFYAPQFKALLGKLSTLNGSKVNIVLAATQGGWMSFYDEKQNGSYRGTPSSVTFGEHSGMNSNKVSEKEREEILKYGQKF